MTTLSLTRWLPAAAVLCAVLGSASHAHAANPYLEEARAKYRELDYQAMPGALAEALLQRDITKGEYIEIFRLQGFCYTVLGDQQKAREAFIRLLVVDPKHEMDSGVSPRFRTAFGKLKKEFDAQGAVSLTHVPQAQPLPVSGAAGDTALEVRVRDAFGRVAQMDIEVRPVLCGKAGGWSRAQLTGAAGVGEERVFKGRLQDPTVSIPGERPAGYYLEYRFLPRNMVNDPVDVAVGAKEYRVTVGSATVAAEPCKAAAPAVAAAGGKADEGGGGGSVLKPVLLGGVVAVGLAVGAVFIVGIVVAAGSGSVGAGVAGYCYVSGACTTQQQGGASKVTINARREG